MMPEMLPDALPERPEVIAKVARRLLPFVAALFIIQVIDKSNVGFAAITMNQALGFTPVTYATGAGIFFVGFFFCEIPSCLMLQRFGARRWMCRIMLSWGLISMGLAFVRTDTQFYVMRFLLGIAEAGFTPGILLYLTYWFPAEERARITARFFLGSPLAVIIGGPLSGALLGLDGRLGLAGWQWLFLLEGLPAVIMGVVVFFYLTDRPQEARWLAEDERRWLTRVMASDEQRRAAAAGHMSVAKALLDWRVLLIGATWASVTTGTYALALWLPQVVKAFGVANFTVGLIVAVPSVLGLVAMVYWARRSDRRNERYWHAGSGILLAAACLAASAAAPSPFLQMVAISLGMMGLNASFGPFWAIPPIFLAGSAAAGGLACANTMGNLGGYIGPAIIGFIKQGTGSYALGFVGVGAVVALGGIIVLLLGHLTGNRQAILPPGKLDPAH